MLVYRSRNNLYVYANNNIMHKHLFKRSCYILSLHMPLNHIYEYACAIFLIAFETTTSSQCTMMYPFTNKCGMRDT